MEVIIRTTVTLDESLVRELVKFSNAKTKTTAVALAGADPEGKTEKACRFSQNS